MIEKIVKNCVVVCGIKFHYVQKREIEPSKIKIFNPLASRFAGAPALKYRYVNTETPSPG